MEADHTSVTEARIQEAFEQKQIFIIICVVATLAILAIILGVTLS